tara:strand:- start:3880 stop:5658 length:1779 start_codon:yes stop_codon:yes gene_type:complete
MARFSSAILNKDSASEVVGCFMSDYEGTHTLGPVQKGGMSNAIINSGSGEYDGGDRCIGGHNSYDIDGDILMTCGWGDGVAFRRLNNDGTMTKLYYDSQALWRDTTSTYNHLQSVAMAKNAGKAVVMSYNVYGYSIFDYRGAKDGTTNGGIIIREDRPSHPNPTDFIDTSGTNSRANGYVRRTGYWYAGGLCAAGDWIYASEHDARHYKKFPRRNLLTGEQQMLESSVTKYDGSATNDRNGYRGSLSYDEVNDRMYYWDYEGNGGFTVILDASTNDAKTLWCDLEDTVAGTNSVKTVNGYNRDPGLFIVNPNSEPNVIMCGGYDHILKVDYTPCFTGGVPNVLEANPINNVTTNISQPGYLRVGSKFQKTEGTPTDKLPGSKNFMFVGADRGWAMLDLCYHDIGAGKTWASRRRSSHKEDTTTNGRGSTAQSDYGHSPVLMESANGSKYWIRMGYGNDGHSFKIHREDQNPYELIGDWHVVYGTFTLENNANVDMVFLHNMDSFVIPANCTVNAQVSNDNGSTYESYDITSNESHVFTSTGTQLKVKISAKGFYDSSPFYVEAASMTVNYSSMHDAAKKTNIKHKHNRKRLR